LHEIKFDGYRVIARKDGEQVRLWARTTSDYSKSFTRIRDAVAALPINCAVRRSWSVSSTRRHQEQ
jgi:bifunctional non-homologous end joining protein LigD